LWSGEKVPRRAESFFRDGTLPAEDNTLAHVMSPASSDTSESTWIIAAQGGDLASYAELIRVHRAAVLGYLAVRLAHFHDAEDLAQEAFVIAFRKLAEFDVTRPFGPWLRGIALHLLRNHQRKFLPIGVGGAAEVQQLIDQRLETFWQGQDESQMLGALRECLQEIDGPSRTLLTDRYVAGQTVREIARHRGRGYSALTMQLHRVREVLRRCVELKLAAP
jgi:RNA polymerase sigma-70 factor, ECF subfamily